MKDLLNRKEIAEHYKIDVATVNAWRRKGMPYIKLATGRIVYDLEAVETWLLGK